MATTKTPPKRGKRKPNGKAVRASRKNRQTGTTITIVDASLLTEYLGKKLDPAKGRWATVSEQTKAVAHWPSFDKACVMARVPAEWSKAEARRLAKKEAK